MHLHFDPTQLTDSPTTRHHQGIVPTSSSPCAGERHYYTTMQTQAETMQQLQCEVTVSWVLVTQPPTSWDQQFRPSEPCVGPIAQTLGTMCALPSRETRPWPCKSPAHTREAAAHRMQLEKRFSPGLRHALLAYKVSLSPYTHSNLNIFGGGLVTQLGNQITISHSQHFSITILVVRHSASTMVSCHGYTHIYIYNAYGSRDCFFTLNERDGVTLS